MRDASTLMQSIDDHVAELDRVGKLLDRAFDAFSQAEELEAEAKETADEAIDDSIAEQIRSASLSEGRAPSDGKMDALARVECREELQTLHGAQRRTKTARRLKEKLEKAQSREAEAIRGEQSILKSLREEAAAPNPSDVKRSIREAA